MKNFLYKTKVILLLVVLFTSCKKDFLDIVPKGSLVARTVTDYDLLMNSNLFYEYNYGLPAQVMGAEVAAEQGVLQNAPASMQRAFAWDDQIVRQGESYDELKAFLNNIYTCNSILSGIGSASGGTDAKKGMLKAEARATRALLYFYFINTYAKPYNPATAATDPGFPIITQPEISVNTFTRNSLAEVYAFIIDDLRAAISDLPVDNGIRTRMSRPAAKALLGKVYMFMGRPADALPNLEGAFTDMATSSNSPVLYNYNQTFAADGSFLPIGFFGPTYPGNNRNDLTESLLLKTARAGETWGSGFGSNGLILTDQQQSLFNAADFRLNFYSNLHDDGSGIPAGRIRKYALQYVHIGVELADVILLRAEARARVNDLSGARSDLEELRRNRMPETEAGIPAAVAGSKDELIRFIIQERRREFAAEGHIWYDMRRLSADPLFPSLTYTHQVFGHDGNAAATYQLKTERFTLRLPADLLSANPGMTDNP